MYGKKTELNTRAETIQELLDEREITLEENDEVNLPLSTRILDDMAISIDNVERDFETVEEVVVFEEEQIKDAQQPLNYRRVKEPGQNGRKLVTYEVVIKTMVSQKKLSKKKSLPNNQLNK